MDRRAIGGRQVGGVEDVLDANRQPGERQARKLGPPGVAPRRFEVERREGADLGLARRDGRGAEIDYGARGELAGRDPAHEIEG
jgi:hypothetical protein